ncbi:MAG TPA: hypothetical protein VHC90_23635 [Bryobacteraceae bacterium]|nr:hypothetical protein [Bryobacteraceae bacterium]
MKGTKLNTRELASGFTLVAKAGGTLKVMGLNARGRNLSQIARCRAA